MKAYESHHLRFLPVEGTFSSGISFAPTGSSERKAQDESGLNQLHSVLKYVQPSQSWEDHGSTCMPSRLMDFGWFNCVFHLKLSPQVQLHPLVLSASSGSWNCQVRWGYPLELEINMA